MTFHLQIDFVRSSFSTLPMHIVLGIITWVLSFIVSLKYIQSLFIPCICIIFSKSMRLFR